MSIQLSAVPVYVDVADATFAVDAPVKASTLTQLAHNAKFAAVRREVFVGLFNNGDTVPLPVSSIDGYQYSYAEITFWWSRQFSYNPTTKKPSGGGCIYEWTDSVSAAGVVAMHTQYYIDGGADTVTNDGQLVVYLFCQRNAGLRLSEIPVWADVEDGDLGGGEALLASNLLQLNQNIRYAAVRKEFFVQTLYNGQAVTPPTSPVDGYTYKMQSEPALTPPPAPQLSSIVGGTLLTQNIFVKLTYLNAAGETTAGAEASIALAEGTLAVVASPPPSGDAVSYNVYAGQSSGGEVRQNSSPIAIGTGWDMPTGGISGGVAPPMINSAGLGAPAAPVLYTSVGGTLSALTYYFRLTYVDGAGETTGGAEASKALAAGQIPTVQSPVASGGATGYNIYAGWSSGSEVRQNSSPIAIGQGWTMPTSGLAGTPPPALNTTAESELQFCPSMISSNGSNGQHNGGGCIRQFGVSIGGMHGVTDPAAIGQVKSFVHYYVNGGAETISTDGTILVLIIATRSRGLAPVPPAVRVQPVEPNSNSFGALIVPLDPTATINGQNLGPTVQNLDPNGVLTAPGADFSRAYKNQNLDYLPGGNSYQPFAGPLGHNALENPSFEFPAAPGSGDIAAGWFDQTGNLYGFAPEIESSDTEPHSGTHDIDIEIPTAGLSVPANGSIYSAFLARKRVAAVPGQTWRVGGWVNIQQAVAPAAGLSYQVAIFARAEYSDASYTQFGSYSQWTGTSTLPWTYGGTTFTVPATPSGKALLGVDVGFEFLIANANSAATTAAKGAWGVRFDDVSLVRLTDYDNEIDESGGAYLRMPAGNMDSTRRGLIDFTQAGHVGKSLANVPDDGGSGRTARIMQYLGGNSAAGWFMLGTWTFPQDGGGHTLVATGYGGQGYNHSAQQQSKIEVIVRSGDGGVDNVAPNISGASYFGFGQNNGFVAGVKVVSHGGSTSPTQSQWDLYVDLNVWCAAHWVFDMDSGSSFSWAPSSAPVADPGAASSTVVIATGAPLHDQNGALISNIGPSGYTQMLIGNGSIALSTGGASARQAKKFPLTAPTGLQANGTFIEFANLTDQAGNALPGFDNPPLVGLIPYGMSPAPLQLFASGMTEAGFTLNSYSAGTQGSSAGIALPNGTAEAYTAPGGATVQSVNVSARMTTVQRPNEPGVSLTFTILNNGTAIGSITIEGLANGGTYSGSTSIAISGAPTSLSLEATWTNGAYAGGSSPVVTVNYATSQTPMSANVQCLISETW